jgi:hypothetical protein
LYALLCRLGKKFRNIKVYHRIQPWERSPNIGCQFSAAGAEGLSQFSINRGMLSAIVVERGGDMMPGKYFFAFAKEKRGRQFKNHTEFWIEEYARVLEFWGRN